MKSVTELAELGLARLTDEQRNQRWFPIRWAQFVGPGPDREIYEALRDSFPDLMPEEGTDIRMGDASTDAMLDYYGKEITPLYFHPEWACAVYCDQWGPYGDTSEGWKSIGVRWSHKRGMVDLSATDRDPADIDLGDAVVGPLGGFGLSRYYSMNDYLETGYEGHGFLDAPDPKADFIRIIGPLIEDGRPTL